MTRLSYLIRVCHNYHTAQVSHLTVISHNSAVIPDGDLLRVEQLSYLMVTSSVLNSCTVNRSNDTMMGYFTSESKTLCIWVKHYHELIWKKVQTQKLIKLLPQNSVHVLHKNEVHTKGNYAHSKLLRCHVVACQWSTAGWVQASSFHNFYPKEEFCISHVMDVKDFEANWLLRLSKADLLVLLVIKRQSST
jgi:hypothetical protein